ncbi:MAG TPA: 1,4-alpha-glucan branching enzyme, partial [Burkholderiales bacterium]
MRRINAATSSDSAPAFFSRRLFGRQAAELLPRGAMSTLTDHDIYLFREGSHARLYEKLGSHITQRGPTHFGVWAPNAREVCVIGDFNNWIAGANELKPRWDGSGIWETTIPGVELGAAYKYR